MTGRGALVAAVCCGLPALLPANAAAPMADHAPAAPGAILAAAPQSAWRAIPDDELLVFELDGDRRVVMQLAPAFAPAHVANIRALAHGHWFDDTAITRVQDNYVVQWGGASADKPLPSAVSARPPEEYDREAKGVSFRPLGYRDTYARETGMADGWPAARQDGRVWLTHCYGMVGAGRDVPPDTGSGAELYAVIGHSPRHLDRNLALVGRIVQGMDLLAALPRGGDAMGSYAPGQYVTIRRARLASDLPLPARPKIDVLDSDSATYARWLKSRADRPESFFVRPAGAIDICNAQVPIRVGGG
jgi:peptidylprolyl isomerase